nr:zonadhesin-like protein 7 [Plectrocnemia conspersa]
MSKCIILTCAIFLLSPLYYADCRNCPQNEKPGVPNYEIKCKAAVRIQNYHAAVISGCVCVQGLLRNTKGVCVSPNNCDSCGTNEVFTLCANGCENTCAEPNLMTRCVAADCTPGCVCVANYLRNDQGQCVRPTDCSLGCGGDPNAFLNPCGNNCPLTCENKDKPPPCALICLPSACKCNPGYVIGPGGKCILPKNCPSCNSLTEIYSCSYGCEPTCATLSDPCTPNATCVNICNCKEGFARDSTGACVPMNLCPPKTTSTSTVQPLG